jgi:hypothetical protein
MFFFAWNWMRSDVVRENGCHEMLFRQEIAQVHPCHKTAVKETVRLVNG